MNACRIQMFPCHRRLRRGQRAEARAALQASRWRVIFDAVSSMPSADFRFRTAARCERRRRSGQITIQEDRELWAVFLFGLCALLIAFTQSAGNKDATNREGVLLDDGVVDT
jgi:hypothetical protein